MPSHIEALAGDTLTTIQINHKWREIVASALYFFFRHGKTELAYDNDDLLSILLDDLYTAETIGSSMLTREISHDFGGAKNTTNGTYTDVGTASWTHTPTLSKITVECNFEADNSTASRATFRLVVDGVAGNSAVVGFVENTGIRTIALIDSWDVTPGVEFTLKIQFRTAGGTVTIRPQSHCMIRIIEHD